MVFDIFTFVEALWLIIPAYAANGLAPLSKGNHPIDGGRTFRGKPLFGPGKTWEGLIFGTIVAILIAFIMQGTQSNLPWELSPIPLVIVPMTAFMGLFLGLGSMVGDTAGSFVKRRLNLKRGSPAPVLDQDDFVVGALIFAAILFPIKWQWAVLLLIITPIFHLIANIIGYLLKLKNKPY